MVTTLQRLLARRAARLRAGPCGQLSPGIIGWTCDLPYHHEGSHSATVMHAGAQHVTRTWG